MKTKLYRVQESRRSSQDLIRRLVAPLSPEDWKALDDARRRAAVKKCGGRQVVGCLQMNSRRAIPRHSNARVWGCLFFPSSSVPHFSFCHTPPCLLAFTHHYSLIWPPRVSERRLMGCVDETHARRGRGMVLLPRRGRDPSAWLNRRTSHPFALDIMPYFF